MFLMLRVVVKIWQTFVSVVAIDKRNEGLVASSRPSSTNSLLRQQKHAPNIQIQDLRTRMIRRILKFRPPSGTSICDQYIELPLRLLDVFDESHDFRFVGHVRWNSHCAALHARQFVEFLDRLVNPFCPFGFSCADDDFLCSRAKECGRRVKPKAARSYFGVVFSVCFPFFAFSGWAVWWGSLTYPL